MVLGLVLIWMNDGTWFSREQYDGSEWWVHRVRPTLEEVMKEYIETGCGPDVGGGG